MTSDNEPKPEDILMPDAAPVAVAEDEPVYDEESITTLDWKEHIRRRPGMYIGNVDDGSKFDDGIYVLIKEVMDNAVDEYVMGHGKEVRIEAGEKIVEIRDYGRGSPLGKLVDAASRMNTGGKYDSKAFKKAVGLNGVGIKAVNALSTRFYIRSVRDGQAKSVLYSRGEVVEESPVEPTSDPDGTQVSFTPDDTIFKGYAFRTEFIIPMVKNYTYLNTGLAIWLNGKRYVSRGGLKDLLADNMTADPLYQPIHLTGTDIKRLNYSVTRGYKNTNWYAETRFNTNGRPAWTNMVFLDTEEENNAGVRGWNNPNTEGVYEQIPDSDVNFDKGKW